MQHQYNLIFKGHVHAVLVTFKSLSGYLSHRIMSTEHPHIMKNKFIKNKTMLLDQQKTVTKFCSATSENFIS